MPDARSNGLADLAGSWTAADLAEFERATARFEQVAEELWIAACAASAGATVLTFDDHRAHTSYGRCRRSYEPAAWRRRTMRW